MLDITAWGSLRRLSLHFILLWFCGLWLGVGKLKVLKGEMEKGEVWRSVVETVRAREGTGAGGKRRWVAEIRKQAGRRKGKQ